MNLSFHLSKIFRVPGEAAATWPIIADLNELYRSIGKMPATFSPPKQEGHLGEITGTATICKQDIKWEQPPIQWLLHDSISLRRDYHNGPVDKSLLILSLAEEEEGYSQVKIECYLQVRSIFFKPIAYLYTRILVSKLAKAINNKAEENSSQFKIQFSRSQAKHQLVSARMQQVSDTNPTLKSCINSLIRQGKDEELERINFIRYFNLWGLEKLESLPTLYEATAAKLLSGIWTLICEECHQVCEEKENIDEIPATFSCDICQKTWTSEADENVLLNFSIPSEVRPLSPKKYCIGTPVQQPNIDFQFILGPEQQRTIDNDPKKLHILRSDEKIAGPTVTNQTSEPILVRGLTSKRQNSPYLYAMEALSHQVFYKYLGNSALTPGQALPIRNGIFIYIRHQPDSNRSHVELATYLQDFATSCQTKAFTYGGRPIRAQSGTVLYYFRTPLAGTHFATSVLEEDANSTKVSMTSGGCAITTVNDQLTVISPSIEAMLSILYSDAPYNLALSEPLAENEKVAALLGKKLFKKTNSDQGFSLYHKEAADSKKQKAS